MATSNASQHTRCLKACWLLDVDVSIDKPRQDFRRDRSIIKPAAIKARALAPEEGSISGVGLGGARTTAEIPITSNSSVISLCKVSSNYRRFQLSADMRINRRS